MRKDNWSLQNDEATRQMKPEILFALVSNGTGNIKAGFLMSCLRGLRTRNMDLAYVSDGPYVGRARNAVASYFLTKTEIPWLLFIDMDIVFTPEHIDLLFESDEPIVAGMYYIKSANKLQVAAIRFPDLAYSEKFEGRIQVKRAGTGFMRIHRRVFDNLRGEKWNGALYPAKKYNDYEGNQQWNFFPQPITDGELLPEDWGFCDLAREAGFKIMLDTRIKLLHEGVALYPIAK